MPFVAPTAADLGGRHLDSLGMHTVFYYRARRWGSGLISRGIHLLEVHEGFGEMIADMGHFDKVRLGYIVSSLYPLMTL